MSFKCYSIFLNKSIVFARNLSSNILDKTFYKRRFNPRDQFGTLKQENGALQTEKLDRGFDNPWLKPLSGEELLELETKHTRKAYEMNVDKFKAATQITIPFRAKKKLDRQKRKEIKEYMKQISLRDKLL